MSEPGWVFSIPNAYLRTLHSDLDVDVFFCFVIILEGRILIY